MKAMFFICGMVFSISAAAGGIAKNSPLEKFMIHCKDSGTADTFTVDTISGRFAYAGPTSPSMEYMQVVERYPSSSQGGIEYFSMAQFLDEKSEDSSEYLRIDQPSEFRFLPQTVQQCSFVESNISNETRVVGLRCRLQDTMWHLISYPASRPSAVLEFTVPFKGMEAHLSASSHALVVNDQGATILTVNPEIRWSLALEERESRIVSTDGSCTVVNGQ